MYKSLHLGTMQEMYFTNLIDLIKTCGLIESTVRNKWAKAKAENPNELENYIVVGDYRITKIEVK